MNPSSHNHQQPRRSSSSFNRHVNYRGNHSNNHQRWPNSDCSVVASSSKEPSYMHGGYPKNPQLSPSSLRNNHNVHYSNTDSSSHQERRHGNINVSDNRRHNLNGQNYQNNVASGPSEPRRHHHVCDNPHGQSSMHGSSGDNGRTIVDFSQRRPQNSEVRVSPVQFQQLSPGYYNQSSSDESIKSESPFRKRRRLSRSGHHIDLSGTSSSPPRRSPRQVPSSSSHSHNNMQDRGQIRNNPRFRERDFAPAHHAPLLLPPSSPPVAHVHAHQTPLMMDLNHPQEPVPISIYTGVWRYTPSSQILCTAPPGAPPHMHTCAVHNVYAAATPQLMPQQFPPCLPPHQVVPPFVPPPAALPVTHQHYTHQHHHLSQQRAEDLDLLSEYHPVRHSHSHNHTTIHGPPAIPLTSTLPQVLAPETRQRHLEWLTGRTIRNAPINQPRPGWRPNPTFMPPTQYSGILLHILAMFSNPALSQFNQNDLNTSDTSSDPENYEALLNLADQLGEAKARGLSKMEIDSLLCYKFNVETHQADQTSCVVCMCDFEARQMIRVLPCSHEFHAKCIDKWLKSNRTCPICRGNASDYFNNSTD